MDVALDYSDVVLVPQYSDVRTRKDVDTKIEFGEMSFNLPVVPSNMPAVVSMDLAEKLAHAGYFYIMHRFGDKPHRVLEQCLEQDIYSSLSIGVQDIAHRDLKILRGMTWKIDFITIDIAHGHHEMMEETIDTCKSFFPNAFLIAGNVGTLEAVVDLASWGANAVKVGVGPGAACTTYDKTGFRTPMFSTVLECSQVGIPIIADGGIRSDGDIAKALAAGATMVMVGSQLAGYSDSPGEWVYDDESGKTVYEFYGSASKKNGNKTEYIEGKTTLLSGHRGESVLDRLHTMRESLQSAVSYAGGKSIKDLKGTQWKRIR